MIDPLRQELIDLGSALAAASPEVLRVACNEDDKSTAATPDAGHFLKLNGERLGRDLELYGFLGAITMGWGATLAYFLEEVVMPLKQVAPSAYTVACEKLREIGKRTFPPDLHVAWEELLAA